MTLYSTEEIKEKVIGRTVVDYKEKYEKERGITELFFIFDDGTSYASVRDDCGSPERDVTVRAVD